MASIYNFNMVVALYSITMQVRDLLNLIVYKNPLKELLLRYQYVN